jgi:hypothetical protein
VGRIARDVENRSEPKRDFKTSSPQDLMASSPINLGRRSGGPY